MRIDQRHLDIAMPKDLLRGEEVPALHDEVGREGVAQGMPGWTGTRQPAALSRRGRPSLDCGPCALTRQPVMAGNRSPAESPDILFQACKIGMQALGRRSGRGLPLLGRPS